MKHTQFIISGVICFAFACLIGTSCSKKTETSTASIEKDGGVTILLEVSVPDILDALTGHNLTPDYKHVFDFACRQIQEGESNDFLKTFFEVYELRGLHLAPLFRAKMSDRIEWDTPNKDIEFIVQDEIYAIKQNITNVLCDRLDRFGITSYEVQDLNNYRIRFSIPGKHDVKRLHRLFYSSANLEFWETYALCEVGTEQNLQPLFGLFAAFGDSYSPVIGTANVADTAKINETLNRISRDFPRDARFAWEVKPVDETGQYFRLIALKATNRRGPVMEGDAITDARAEESGYFNGNGEVILKMNASGARKWEEITKKNIGKQIAIVLDDEVYSFPTVQSAITGGVSSITGNFTMEEAQDLANILKSGRMSAPIRVVYMEVIEPQQ